jgi:hypothetical protein
LQRRCACKARRSKPRARNPGAPAARRGPRRPVGQCSRRKEHGRAPGPHTVDKSRCSPNGHNANKGRPPGSTRSKPKKHRARNAGQPADLRLITGLQHASMLRGVEVRGSGFVVKTRRGARRSARPRACRACPICASQKAFEARRKLSVRPASAGMNGKDLNTTTHPASQRIRAMTRVQASARMPERQEGGSTRAAKSLDWARTAQGFPCRPTSPR